MHEPPTLLIVFVILFIAVGFVTAIYGTFKTISKTSLKDMFEAGAVTIENERLLNELLKKKLNKNEDLTDEEAIQILKHRKKRVRKAKR